MSEAVKPPNYVESLEGFEQIRMTLSNVVQTLTVEGRNEAPQYFAMLDPKKLNKGVREFGALGGTIQLTELGQRLVKAMGGELLGSSASEKDDARVSVPTSKYLKLLPYLSRLQPALFEDQGDREIIEELSHKEYDAYPPILTEEEAKSIRCTTHGMYQERPRYEGKSGRYGKDMPFTRMIFVSTISVSETVYEKLRSSPVMHFFSETEVERIAQARFDGMKEKTDGGDLIASTLLGLSKRPSPISERSSTPLYAEDTAIDCAILVALAEAIEAGNSDLRSTLQQLILPGGEPANLSDEKIDAVLQEQVPGIRELIA